MDLPECDVCGRPFATEAGMKTHKTQKHGEEPVGEDYMDMEVSICEGCEDPFEHNPYRERKYCCHQCANPPGSEHHSWKGGFDGYRGPNWGKKRRDIMERDGEECVSCGISSGRLEVHHIVPFREWDNHNEANQPSNLTTLCPTCHRYAEYFKFEKLARRGNFNRNLLPRV